jgi:hypothetical protein
MITPELQSKLAVWKQRAAAGTLTPNEMREAILALRENRRSAAVPETKSRSRTKGPAKSADDLLGELENL